MALVFEEHRPIQGYLMCTSGYPWWEGWQWGREDMNLKLAFLKSRDGVGMCPCESKLLSQCLLFFLLPAGFLCACQVPALTWLWLAVALTLPHGILLPSAVLLIDRSTSCSFRFLGQTVIIQLDSSCRPWVLQMANMSVDCPLARGRNLTY